MNSFWRVAIDAPLPEVLTYRNDNALPLRRGLIVKAPLGKRQASGLVLGPTDQAPQGIDLKSVTEIDSEYPEFSEPFVRWLEWLSRYYLYPPGPTALLALPPLSRQVKERKSKRAPVISADIPRSVPPELSEEQKKCIADISAQPDFQTHLVFGVTGSGKTEIYLHLLEKTLAEGKSGLVLVPEISLTPQLIQRFAARFGDAIAALHSQLTDRERTNQWWDMVEGRKKILIGARSALFCPIENLGMIIVDEEHEPSFKQDEKLKYHGRDAAVMLGHLYNCPVVLGSATPSLESWHNALEGKYRLHQLKNRVAGRQLPQMSVVDLRQKPDPAKTPPGLPYWLSPELYEMMVETLGRGEQVALFLNRRGMAHLVVCPSCGHTRKCPNCDINLTLHADKHLICHYCDYHENFKAKCQDCREGTVEAIGLGTELIEKELAPLFPLKRIARADRDEIQNRHDLETLIQDMESGEIDILVGTQMIAKGLDFPKLKLVGLVLADVGFNLPDFRATERSFQLMTQMAGRSGRHIQPGESPGAVVIQTFNTEHDSLKFALHHDFEGFAAHEISFRQALRYPPVGRLVSFRIQAADLRKARSTAQTLSMRARHLQERHEPYKGLEILGPAEAPLARIRNQYRFQVLIKGLRPDHLNQFARQILGDEKWVPSGARILADVDPLHLL